MFLLGRFSPITLPMVSPCLISLVRFLPRLLSMLGLLFGSLILTGSFLLRLPITLSLLLPAGLMQTTSGSESDRSMRGFHIRK